MDKIHQIHVIKEKIKVTRLYKIRTYNCCTLMVFQCCFSKHLNANHIRSGGELWREGRWSKTRLIVRLGILELTKKPRVGDGFQGFATLRLPWYPLASLLDLRRSISLGLRNPAKIKPLRLFQYIALYHGMSRWGSESRAIPEPDFQISTHLLGLFEKLVWPDVLILPRSA